MSVDALLEDPVLDAPSGVTPPVATTDFQRPVYCILGLPFDAVTLDAAVFLVGDAASERRRFFFSTPNLNFAIGCRQDAAFRESVLQSDLSVADGMPLIWVARAMGLPFRERVPGSSIFEGLRHARGSQISTYFFGGPAGVGAKACATLNEEASGLRCVGFAMPGYLTVDQLSEPDVIEAINETGADFLVVALSARKGQCWILQNRDVLTVPVVSDLGAVVNFVAGTVSRAPKRWQRFGLEWFWRIRQEPHLWQRYAKDGFHFVRLVLTTVVFAAIDARYTPSREQLTAARVWTTIGDADAVIALSGDWTVRNLGPLRTVYADVAAAGTDIVVDVAAIAYFDSAWVALLLLLRGHQGKVRRTLRLRSASRTTRRRLAAHGVDYLDCID